MNIYEIINPEKNKLIAEKTVTFGLNRCIKTKNIEIHTAAANSPNLSITAWNMIPRNNNSSDRALRKKLIAASKIPKTCKFCDNSIFTPINTKKDRQIINVITVIIITKLKFLLVSLSQKNPRYMTFELGRKYSMIAEGIKTTSTTKTSFIKGRYRESNSSTVWKK